MSEIASKIANFQKIMKSTGIDYYIIPTSDPHMSEYVCDHYMGRKYMSGFTGDAGTLLIGTEFAAIWTDGRFFTQAENELSGTGIFLYKMGMPSVPKITEFLYENVRPDQCVAADGFVIFSQLGQRINKLCKDRGAKFVTDVDLLDEIWTDRPAIPANEIKIMDSEITGILAIDKIKDIQAELVKEGLDGYLFSKLDDVMWIFNIRGNDVAYNPVAISYAYITQSKAVLFVQKDVIDEELKIYAKKNGFKIKKYEKIKKYLSKNINEKEIVGYDELSLNYSLYELLEKACTPKRHVSIAEIKKSIKNQHEIEQIKEYFRQDSAALIKGLKWIDDSINAGLKISEYDISKKLRKLRSEIAGFVDESFPTIAGFKDNGAVIHYEPKAGFDKEISGDGLLVIDSGGQYTCATTDVTRTILIGTASAEEKRRFTDVTVGMLKLQNTVFLEGCSGRNLDIIARKRLWDNGLNFNHGTGHGVGCCLNVHEGPQAIRYKYTDTEKYGELKAGMLITDEPGFYEPGKFGIRSENTLLVEEGMKTEYGQFLRFRPLTLVPLDIKLFDTESMDEEEIKMVNQYHKLVFESVEDLLDDETLSWLKERLFLCYSN